MVQLIAELRELWAEHRAEVEANVVRVEDAVGVLMVGRMDDPKRDSARRAAHQLAGTVGTFGFADASEHARALEEALERGPGREDAPRLAELAKQLRTGLEDHDEPRTGSRPDTDRGSARPPPDGLVIDSGEARRLPDARPSILAIDDDPAILAAVRVLLGGHGWTISSYGDPATIWDALERHRPDLLLLDVDMPGTTGIELCRTVRADPRWTALPVVFLTARRDPETMEAAFGAGADDFVNKPIVAAELLTRLANRLERTRLQATEAVDVVVVEDDLVLSDLLQGALQGRGYSCHAIPDGDEAVKALAGERPRIGASLLLLDWDLPGRNGPDVLRDLGRAGVLARTRVITLISRSGEGAALAGLELGAFDHVAKPFRLPVLLERVHSALAPRQGAA